MRSLLRGLCAHVLFDPMHSIMLRGRVVGEPGQGTRLVTSAVVRSDGV